jgi:hypothetical protein
MTSNIHNIDFFEKENARDLTIEQIVRTFVPTRTFHSMLTAKNHIVLGSRGSGKTSIAKMISHSHLSKYETEEAQDIINSKKYIGIYVPMSTEWLGGVNNKKYISELEQDLLFQWKLNVIVCAAFIDCLQSCCDTYIQDITQRVLTEISIVNKLITYWAPNKNIKNFKDLKEYLKFIDFEKQKIIAKERILGVKSTDLVGIEFDTRLFSPLQRGIDIASKELDFPDYTAWLLCLDEAEVLTKEQQKIINSYLRSCTGNLFFKIITMPYSHNTRDTNIGAPLNLGDDYEYLYIDYESPFLYGEQSTSIPEPITELFNKRIQASGKKYNGISIEKLLGPSVLLEKKEWNFDPTSTDMQLFYNYTSEKTLARGLQLIYKNKKEDFNNQIGRKMKGILYLKDAVMKTRGAKKLDVYSGTKMVIRCSDANPRKLIRIFKFLLNVIPTIEKKKLSFPMITTTRQSEVLFEFSESALKRVQSEEKIGPDLYNLMNKLGMFMSNSIHGDKINTEQISSITISPDISEQQWILIERAVDNGLLYPNTRWNNSKIMPNKSGEFRLAYVLAPYFRILPRRGDSRKLNTILIKEQTPSKYLQPTLFPDNYYDIK